MDSLPLRNMAGGDHSGHSHFENHHNTRQVSENVHERLINAQDDAPPFYEHPPGLSAQSGKPQLPNPRIKTNNLGNSSPFIPISEEEARRTTNLPELNFRPTALKAWYLSILMLWQFLCICGVVALIVLDETRPPWFRFGSRSSFWMWLYIPGLIGFLTTVSWRSTVQWYNRIIPYVRMANIPTSPSWQYNHRTLKNLSNMSLNGVPSGSIDIGHIHSLFASGDYLSAVVNLSILGARFLTPLKSGLFQLVEDERGWQIHVSKYFGVLALAIYVWLLLTTIWILIHLRTRRTGLKWNPTPLASQLCLLLGSNIFDSFEGIDYSKMTSLKDALKEWPRNGLVLRLGYWKQEESNVITHGVKFLPSQGEFGSEQPNRRQAHHSYDGEPDSYGTDIDRLWNCFLFDWYIIFTTAMGVTLLAFASYAWIKGLIFQPLNLAPRFSSTLLRAVVFSMLPTVAYGAFHLTFQFSDVYVRTLMPIQNMASPLPEEDHRRLFGPNHRPFKGATASDSMLLDYLSPNIFHCISQAIERGHYRIILGVVLATLSNSVFLLVTRIFDFSEAEDGSYTFHINTNIFYASFAIMIIYCLSNWILRPYGPVRTCRPVYSLVDFASLVYRSDILLCPEFWVQDSADSEKHMKAQVTLANRVYQYGIYHGTDGQDHVGIGVDYAPPMRSLDDDNILCLERSANLARAAIASGIYDEDALVSAESFITNEPQRRSSLRRVRTNQYSSWRKKAKKIARLGS